MCWYINALIIIVPTIPKTGYTKPTKSEKLCQDIGSAAPSDIQSIILKLIPEYFDTLCVKP